IPVTKPTPPPVAPPSPPKLAPLATGATTPLAIGFPANSAVLSPPDEVALKSLANRRGGHHVEVVGFGDVTDATPQVQAEGIDLGMGNPDSPTPPHIVAKLVEAVQDPRTHRYSTSRGIPGLRRALAGYYRRRFDVALDPESEVIVTLGSKEGLANLAAAVTSP